MAMVPGNVRCERLVKQPSLSLWSVEVMAPKKLCTSIQLPLRALARLSQNETPPVIVLSCLILLGITATRQETLSGPYEPTEQVRVVPYLCEQVYEKRAPVRFLLPLPNFAMSALLQAYPGHLECGRMS